MRLSFLTRLVCVMSLFAALAGAALSEAVMASPSTYLVPVGESRVYRLDRPVTRVAVGDPEVADYILFSSSELYLLGKKPGATNLVLWDGEGSFKSTPLQVSRNTNPIKDMLRAVLPNETDIQIYAWGPALVLSGSVSNALAAETACRLVKGYLGGRVPVQNPEYTLVNSAPASEAPSSVTGMVKNTSEAESEEPESIRGVVNLLTVRDPQQVRLEVRIAEISQTCAQKLGLDWYQGAGNLSGSSLMTGFVGDATLKLFFENGNSSYIEAECKQGLIKILAKPTIVAMSGQEGYFLVGGKVYTPTVTSNGAVDYKERKYGVGLRFIPTVLDSGRISLKVAPEVSEPLKEALTAGTATGLPSFKLSYASTTVQMNEGENLVIGGLLRDNLEETIQGLPLLSKIPLLGALFRRTEKSSEKTELMVVVRPTLVKASVAEPSLPTDRFVPPTDSELFIEGKIHGSPEGQ
ncbi:secretion system protein [Prosthecochloris sp. GSB1]|uniref:type II and III secretion system protein family protein n=1 Tax=Prosthecochloris sp. GSB1 TaxID=281093 RepID=UPI000B8CC99D|nr:pilus assembly protein N-terminal domain-containing protein [Prosthecochloris sp. GSB1]ASQ90245.1 secretion system protein [Prosthecochloris sp. GSB1]